jgi:hypothetical protein
MLSLPLDQLVLLPVSQRWLRDRQDHAPKEDAAHVTLVVELLGEPARRAAPPSPWWSSYTEPLTVPALTSQTTVLVVELLARAE